MKIFAILVASVFAAYFLAMVGFTMLATARKLAKLKCLPWDWKVCLFICIYGGGIGDIIFNCTRAWWIFREPPKELMFTSRIQRHVNEGDWTALVIKWVVILNTGEAGHIKLPPGFPLPM